LLLIEDNRLALGALAGVELIWMRRRYLYEKTKEDFKVHK